MNTRDAFTALLLAAAVAGIIAPANKEPCCPKCQSKRFNLRKIGLDDVGAECHQCGHVGDWRPFR